MNIDGTNTWKALRHFLTNLWLHSRDTGSHEASYLLLELLQVYFHYIQISPFTFKYNNFTLIMLTDNFHMHMKSSPLHRSRNKRRMPVYIFIRISDARGITRLETDYVICKSVTDEIRSTGFLDWTHWIRWKWLKELTR